MTQHKARLDFLDSLRGVAAVAVMLAHYIEEMESQHVFSGIGAQIASLVDFFNLGKFGVALFFIISGYIIPNSLGVGSDRIGRFCISRFFRLYPLYWVVLAVYLFVIGGDQLTNILANITMVEGYLGKADIVGVAWTLQIELTFYATCVALALVSKLSSPRTCFSMSIFFLVIAVLLGIARGLLVKKLPVALPLALSLMYFGTVWRQATLDRLPEAKRLAFPLLGIICVTIVPLSVIAYNHDFGFQESWLPYSLSYLLAISLFVICTTKLPVSAKGVVWLGIISYSVYLLHPLVSLVSERLRLTAVDVPLDPFVLVLLRVSIVLAVSSATYFLIEKPCQDVGRGVIRRMSSAPRVGPKLQPSE